MSATVTVAVMERDRKAVSRCYALLLFGVALVIGATGPMVVPEGLIWIFCGVLIWVAGTIWYRTTDRGSQSALRSASTTRS